VNHLSLSSRLGIYLFLLLNLLAINNQGIAQEARVLPNGIPNWIISATPANSILRPAIWTGRTMYRVGEAAKDFVYFSINQPGYIYIVHFNNAGKAELLLPSAAQPENFFNSGQHRLALDYALPQEGGVHYLQIIASPLTLKDLGKDSTELLPVLGTTPFEARKKILAQIASRQLASGEWGTSWTHYETAQSAPLSETSFSQVIIRAMDSHCQAGLEVRDASVYRDEDKTPFAAFAPVTALKGGHVFRIDALGYRSKTIAVNASGLEPQEICVMLQPDRSIRGKAYFTLNAAPKAFDNIIFDASRSHGLLYEWDFGDGSPIATGERVGHAYNFSGSFNVRLKVQFFDGESEIIANTVIVKPGEACTASFTSLAACKGGSRDKESVTLEASDSQHVNLALLDQSLNGQDAKMRFDVFYELVPPVSTAQTASTQIESYLQFDLYDRSASLLDSTRIYTLNATAPGSLTQVSGQTQSITLILKNMFGLSMLAKAGRLRVSAVLNVQNSSPVKVRYRLAENTLSNLNLPATSPGTSTPTTPPTTPTTQPAQPQTDGGTLTILIILGLLAVVAVVVVLLLTAGGQYVFRITSIV
jgi:PKD repeat protein